MIMNLIYTIESFLNGLDAKTYRTYLGVAVLGLFIILGSSFYFFYSNQEILMQEFEEVNEQRKQVQELIGMHLRVKKLATNVDNLLKEEPDFKIGGYFTTVLSKFSLLDTLNERTSSNIDREGKYRENTLTSRLSGLNMQSLTTLLQEFEQAPRIYIKSLEITRGKQPATLDVVITIATLQLKTISGS